MGKNQKLIILLLLIVLSVALVWTATLSISHIGKIKVAVQLVPNASVLKVDGKNISPGNVYVTKGVHNFRATFMDFTPDSKTLAISSPAFVLLYPKADSVSAQKFLNDYPAVAQEVTNLTQSFATKTESTISQSYPFLSQLPIVGTQGFEIYQAAPQRSKDKTNKIALDIVADAPVYRQQAVDFIRTQLGVDPSTLEIYFEGQANIFNDAGG